jgi:hypothetical protein
MKAVTIGSQWWAGNDEKFTVIDVITIEGYTWVHYRNNDKENVKEYSCYLESFLSRFRELLA